MPVAGMAVQVGGALLAGLLERGVVQRHVTGRVLVGALVLHPPVARDDGQVDAQAPDDDPGRAGTGVGRGVGLRDQQWQVGPDGRRDRGQLDRRRDAPGDRPAAVSMRIGGRPMPSATVPTSRPMAMMARTRTERVRDDWDRMPDRC